MNKRTVLFSVLMTVSSIAYSAMPSLNVSVSDASGKLAFKGKTTAAGTFATAPLAPGEYTVQFNGAAQGNYAVVISAGKEKVMAEAVAGEKFGKGGVAMKVKVGKGLNVTGQVSSGKAGAVAGGDNTKVKIINGKRWFWVANSGTGSHIGGQWVEEGTVEARNVQGLSRDAVTRIQDRGPAGLPGN